jgi:hypothetical protein
MVKLFKYASAADELYQEMERNDTRAQFEHKYAKEIERVNTIERLNKAAETFESIGRIELAKRATELLLRIAQPTKPVPKLSPEEKEEIRARTEEDIRVGKEQPELSAVDAAIGRAKDMLFIAREAFADSPESMNAIEKHYERVVAPGKSDEELVRDINTFVDILASAVSDEDDVAYTKDKKAKKLLDKLNEVFGMFGFKLTEKDAEKLK